MLGGKSTKRSPQIQRWDLNSFRMFQEVTGKMDFLLDWTKSAKKKISFMHLLFKYYNKVFLDKPALINQK